jgi:prolipoprotein diacylglyceryltransferase
MIAATFRFTVEFLRLQPKLFAGLSEAQLFAIALFALGLTGYFLLRTPPRREKGSH